MATVEQLRMYLGERIPVNGSENDTLFTDAELQAILDAYPDGFYAAVAEGWAVKAAAYVRLIDISEGGTERMLSQRYRHAYKQLEFWAGRASIEAETLLVAARSMIVARSAPWGTPASSELPSAPAALEAGPFGTEKQYTRTYPLKRFLPAIKG